MIVKPLQNGSRSLSIDTAYLMLDATVHPDGTVETHAVEIRDPRKPSPQDAAAIAERLIICQSCPSLKKAKPQLNAVSCKDCGCGNLSLLNGKCPRSLWPSPE